MKTQMKGRWRKWKEKEEKQLLDYLRNRRRYWELKKKLKMEKDGNDSLSMEHKEDIQAIIQAHGLD